MVYYLIICRSLTYAQRTAHMLERAGISGHLMKVPKVIAKEGCGYGVKVSERRLSEALKLLRREGMTPRQVFIETENGEYSEARA